MIYIPGDDRAALPEEREVLVGAICGRRTDRWGRATGESLDFFDAKGYVELLDRELGTGLSFAPSSAIESITRNRGRAFSLALAAKLLASVKERMSSN